MSKILDEMNDLVRVNLISLFSLSHAANSEVCQQTEIWEGGKEVFLRFCRMELAD